MTLGGWRRYAGDSGSLAAWLSLRSCLSVASNLDLGDAGRREVGGGHLLVTRRERGIEGSVFGRRAPEARGDLQQRIALVLVQALEKALPRGHHRPGRRAPLARHREEVGRSAVVTSSPSLGGAHKTNLAILKISVDSLGGHNAARRPRTSRRWLTTNTPVTRRSGHPRPACATRSAPRSSHPRPPTQPRTARATTARTRISARSMGTPR